LTTLFTKSVLELGKTKSVLELGKTLSDG